MTRFLLLAVALFLSTNVEAQNPNLNDYSYVVVPEQFDFLNQKDKYQLNSMTKYYFEKSGFNAYLADESPNANRCDGLYVNVEELSSIFGTKLQIVLKDCKENEIYRGQEGKSKYKEFNKTYQDALRKAFKSIEALHVNQKEVVLLESNVNNVAIYNNTKNNSQVVASVKSDNTNVGRIILPNSKFSNYSHNGKTFLLRKTAEGYSLYEESAVAENGLLLKGKIIVMDKLIKYMDNSGKVSEASFDAIGHLTIKDGSSSTVYQAVN